MGKRTLFLHIGYHKTGTTYLQKHVFPQMTATHYFFKGYTPASAAIINAFGQSPDIWRRKGRAIIEQLIAEIGGESNDGWSALVTSEDLSAHKIFAKDRMQFRRDPFLLAAHFRELQQQARNYGATAKVIMGIRRQDQYFASRFSSIGRRVGTMSQRNFEQQMAEILNQSERYFIDGVWLDYKSCRDLIVEALGEGNCLLLPQEQLANDEPGFLKRLGGFLAEPSLVDRIPQKARGTRENARAAGQDEWILGEGMPRILAQKCLNLVGMRFKPNRLYLTDELKSRILDVYRDSNRRLAHDLDVDLGQYGYY